MGALALSLLLLGPNFIEYVCTQADPACRDSDRFEGGVAHVQDLGPHNSFNSNRSQRPRWIVQGRGSGGWIAHGIANWVEPAFRFWPQPHEAMSPASHQPLFIFINDAETYTRLQWLPLTTWQLPNTRTGLKFIMTMRRLTSNLGRPSLFNHAL